MGPKATAQVRARPGSKPFSAFPADSRSRLIPLPRKLACPPPHRSTERGGDLPRSHSPGSELTPPSSHWLPRRTLHSWLSGEASIIFWAFVPLGSHGGLHFSPRLGINNNNRSCVLMPTRCESPVTEHYVYEWRRPTRMTLPYPLFTDSGTEAPG